MPWLPCPHDPQLLQTFPVPAQEALRSEREGSCSGHIPGGVGHNGTSEARSMCPKARFCPLPFLLHPGILGEVTPSPSPGRVHFFSPVLFLCTRRPQKKPNMAAASKFQSSYSAQGEGGQGLPGRWGLAPNFRTETEAGVSSSLGAWARPCSLRSSDGLCPSLAMCS